MQTTTSRFVARILGSVAASAIAISGGAAFAADADTPGAQAAQAQSSDQTVIDEIIVTARKVQERLQDVPVAVTAFSGDSLKQQNAATVIDVARFTPGLLTVPGSNNPTVIAFSIRGQVQGDNLATLEPSVGTYIDGIYVARAYGINGDLVDVANVQVLKGPQGTLFGRNTSAGAVLIETKKPDLQEVGGELSGGYGRYNDVTGSVVLNVPIVKDVLGVRGAFQYRNRDGYIKDDLTGSKYNNIDSLTGRVKVLYEPSSTVSILAQADWYQYKSNGPVRVMAYGGPNYLVNTPAPLIAAGLPDCSQPANAFSCAPVPTYGTLIDFGALAGPPFNIPGAALTAFGIRQFPNNYAYYSTLNAKDPNRTAADYLPATDTKTQSYSLTAAVDTSIGQFKAIGGYRKVTASSAIDLDGTPYQILATTGVQDLHQWSSEGQLTGATSNKKFNYVAGVTYFTENGYDLSFSSTLVPLQAPGYYRGEIKNKSFGIYAQGTYHLTDKLAVTGGLRWSSDKKGLITHNQSLVPLALTSAACALPGATFTPGADKAVNCTLGHDDTFKQLSYLASIDYHITPDLLVYAKMSKGYRSGGENLRANGDAATFAPFVPEINYEEEIGIKADFLDHKVRVNLAGYYNKIINAQRSQLLAVPSGPLAGALLTVLGNAQRVRNVGFEADLQVAVTPDITLQASGNVNDAKYLRYDVPMAFGSTILADHRGENFGLTPKGSFTLAGNYKHYFGGVGVRARVDYSWTSRYYTSGDTCGAYPVPSLGVPCIPLPAAELTAQIAPAAGILGARVGISFNDDRYSIDVWGRNLTDNRDYNSAFNVSPFGLTSAIRRDPATYGVSLSVKY